MKARLILLAMCAAMLSISCLFLPSFLVSDRRTIRSEEKLFVLDGKCIVILKYNANGSIKDITAQSTDPTDTNSCGVTDKENLRAYGQPVLDNAAGITFALENVDPQTSSARTASASGSTAAVSGKMICYGPPIPSPSRCVCTMKPCP
jgi:hypothetical protein